MASKILKELHETAKDMHVSGTLDTTTMREFDALCLPPVKKLTARQRENGDKEPSGSSLKLLSIVQEKGLEAIA